MKQERSLNLRLDYGRISSVLSQYISRSLVETQNSRWVWDTNPQIHHFIDGYASKDNSNTSSMVPDRTILLLIQQRRMYAEPAMTCTQ